jgi:uncharacterized Zn finger protein (UPF0148 family)
MAFCPACQLRAVGVAVEDGKEATTHRARQERQSHLPEHQGIITVRWMVQ